MNADRPLLAIALMAGFCFVAPLSDATTSRGCAVGVDSRSAVASVLVSVSSPAPESDSAQAAAVRPSASIVIIVRVMCVLMTRIRSLLENDCQTQ